MMKELHPEELMAVSGGFDLDDLDDFAEPIKDIVDDVGKAADLIHDIFDFFF